MSWRARRGLLPKTWLSSKPESAAVVGAGRFLAEIETTANLQHPHILPLFDSGEADGFLFYVIPHVEGESLRERIDRDKQLPVEEAVQIATAVAHALQHAHDRGVIHRDIKPENILMQDGRHHPAWIPHFAGHHSLRHHS